MKSLKQVSVVLIPIAWMVLQTLCASVSAQIEGPLPRIDLCTFVFAPLNSDARNHLQAQRDALHAKERTGKFTDLELFRDRITFLEKCLQYGLLEDIAQTLNKLLITYNDHKSEFDAKSAGRLVDLLLRINFTVPRVPSIMNTDFKEGIRIASDIASERLGEEDIRTLRVRTLRLLAGNETEAFAASLQQLFERAKDRGGSAEIFLEVAQEFERLRRYDASEQALRKAIASSEREHNRRQREGLVIYLALQQYRLGDYTDCVKTLTPITPVAGGSFRWSRILLSAAMIRSGDKDRGIKLLEECYRDLSESRSPSDSNSLDYLREALSQLYIETRRADDAIEVYRTASPSVPDCRQQMILARNLSDGGYLDQSTRLLSNTLPVIEKQSGRLSTAASMMRLELACDLSSSGKKGEALALYHRLVDESRVKDDDLSSALTQLAAYQAKEGMYEEAESNLRKVLALRTKLYGPNDCRSSYTLYNLTQVLVRRGKQGEALQNLPALREAKCVPLGSIIRTFKAMNEYSRAIEVCEGVRSSYSDDPGMLTWGFYLGLADLYYKNAQKEKALECLSKLSGSQGSVTLPLYIEMGEFSKASEICHRWVRETEASKSTGLDYGEPYHEMIRALTSLAEVQMLEGDYSSAAATLNRCNLLLKPFGPTEQQVVLSGEQSILLVKQNKLLEAEKILSETLSSQFGHRFYPGPTGSFLSALEWELRAHPTPSSSKDKASDPDSPSRDAFDKTNVGSVLVPGVDGSTSRPPRGADTSDSLDLVLVAGVPPSVGDQRAEPIIELPEVTDDPHQFGASRAALPVLSWEGRSRDRTYLKCCTLAALIRLSHQREDELTETKYLSSLSDVVLNEVRLYQQDKWASYDVWGAHENPKRYLDLIDTLPTRPAVSELRKAVAAMLPQQSRPEADAMRIQL